MRRLALLVLASAVFTTAAADPVAEIVSLDGTGDYREAQQPAWRAAKVKQSLFPTNFVRTGDLSRMGLLFVDRTQLRLAPNSVLQIKESTKGQNAKTILNLNAGRSWMQSKTTPQGLTVETPSALAAIRGTDWEMAVDAEGRVTLSVFSGEVVLYNEQGSVNVQRGEQARAEKGRAPVKLQVTVSRDRIQWVSSITVDPDRYEGTRGLGLVGAYALLKRATTEGAPPADAYLLLADIEAFQGDLDAAAAALTKGGARFPDDERFAANLSRLALLAGDAPRALALARDAAQRKPDSVEAWLAVGDAARLDGRAVESAAAYERAIKIAAGDARGWHGLGVVEGERENLRRARTLLNKALALRATPQSAAELGTVATIAARYTEARNAFERALEMQPDHYVAWTGLGILHMRTGDLDAATEALLKASLVEPRYSRAHLYLAAAYYQAGRREAAREELQRAAETDPKDPLPRLLTGLILLDAIDPVAAAAEAREALARIPFLKSLDAVADNQKGVANVGSALAFMGLEAWARSAAQDSYLPFWGGSHLFLADRYPGEFSRRSELMQGFVTDPLAFGASNRFQSLVPTPGHHATVSLRYNRSDDLALTEPVIAANGLVAGEIPFAYFIEGIDTRIDPRNTAFEARAKTLTVALGVKPMHELSLFLYGNRLSADVDLGSRDVTGEFGRLTGSVERIDVGARYAASADQALWVKAGASREDSDLAQLGSVFLPQQTLERRSAFETKPEGRDAGLRYTRRVNERLEVSAGAEGARLETPITLGRDTSLHFAGTDVPQEYLDQKDIDRSRAIYALARVGRGALVGELGVAWRDYRKDRDIRITRDSGVIAITEEYHLRGTDPMAGVVWKPLSGHTARLACRRWLRPIALDTLMPVAIAGVPVEDQLVFAGGELKQCRVQWEWTISAASFLEAHYEQVRTKNLVSPLDGILNTRSDVTNLDRLRNRVLTPPGRTDELEGVPVYAEGIARRAHVAYERTLGGRVAVRLHYEHTDSENTDPIFPGREIPYLARQRADVGLTWAPGWRTFITLAGTWRSRRYSDEANTVPLPAGWDARVNVFVESRDKRWAVEAYAYNLLKKEASDVVGVVASWRF